MWFRCGVPHRVESSLFRKSVDGLGPEILLKVGGMLIRP